MPLFLGPGRLVLSFLLPPLFLIYLLPGIIASFVRHPRREGIWLLDILTGWSGVGWIAALIWALMSPVEGARQSSPTGASPSAPAEATAPASPRDVAAETNRWAFFLHLSLLAGYIVPLAGFIAPLVIWQSKKQELPGLDVHGRNATNWIISELIYGAAAGVLAIIIIGLPLLMALALAAVIFPIVAAVKATDGKTWIYPLALPILQ